MESTDKRKKNSVPERGTLFGQEEVRSAVDEKQKTAMKVRNISASIKKMKLTTLRVFGGYVYESGDEHYFIPDDMGGQEEISVDSDDSRVVLMYNWDVEINEALPTLGQIRDNIRKALWRNGALTKDHAQESRVKRNLMKGAFPYKIDV